MPCGVPPVASGYICREKKICQVRLKCTRAPKRSMSDGLTGVRRASRGEENSI